MSDTHTVYHVSPESHGHRWLVAEEGTNGTTDAYEQRDEAIEAAKTLAQAHGPATVKVHTADGGLEYERDYGKDPLVEQLEKFGF